MPFYDYAPDRDGCTHCMHGFEVRQSIQEKPLERCPSCGTPCHRVYSAFSLGSRDKDILSPQNIAKNGFTQYKRNGKGYYEKTAGAGPNAIVG